MAGMGRHGVDVFRESRRKPSRRSNGLLQEALFDNILGRLAGQGYFGMELPLDCRCFAWMPYAHSPGRRLPHADPIRPYSDPMPICPIPAISGNTGKYVKSEFPI